LRVKKAPEGILMTDADRAAQCPSHAWVKELKEDSRVQGLYLAKDKKIGQTKKGDPFLSITLSDRTGDIEAKVWDNAMQFSSLFREGDILEIQGQTGSYKGQIQLTLSGLRVSDDGDPALFLETAPYDISEMVASLRSLIKKIKDHNLRTLCERFLADHSFLEQFKRAPAAKNFHHNYVGGLLEHTLSVCRLAVTTKGHYPNLDGDLLLSGAFLHDIGKIREFSYNSSIDYTDEGRLLGHLVLGVGMIEEKMSAIKRFPEETALRLKHLILSHHGEYEFGSPKRPKFLEALALHTIDDLDAKMNGIGRYMERDTKDGSWTDFNRMFERYFLKGTLPLSVADDAVSSPVESGKQGSLFS
jgi:3'-5' exoribonuclease